MTMATTDDRPVKRRKSAPTDVLLVSANKLAAHFGIARQNVDRLAQEGVICREPGSNLFDQDKARLAYFNHLRSERRQSPASTAQSKLAEAKAEALRLKTAKELKELVPLAAFE